MLHKIKVHAFTEIDKEIYTALCRAAKRETLLYCEPAFLQIHKSILNRSLGDEKVSKILNDPMYARSFVDSEYDFSKKVDGNKVDASLQSMHKKIDDHAQKSDASFKKLIASASLFFVLPISLAGNIATAFFNDEITEFKRAFMRIMSPESAKLPKGMELMPSHVPFKKEVLPQPKKTNALKPLMVQTP